MLFLAQFLTIGHVPLEVSDLIYLLTNLFIGHCSEIIDMVDNSEQR